MRGTSETHGVMHPRPIFGRIGHTVLVNQREGERATYLPCKNVGVGPIVQSDRPITVAMDETRRVWGQCTVQRLPGVVPYIHLKNFAFDAEGSAAEPSKITQFATSSFDDDI